MNQKATGFASPALGYEEKSIDLNRLLIRNPPATYFFRLESNDMAALGMPRGSLLIVDRSKAPSLNEYVLIRHESRFMCRRLAEEHGKTVFANSVDYIKPIENDTEIIGTVTAAINIMGNKQE